MKLKILRIGVHGVPGKMSQAVVAQIFDFFHKNPSNNYLPQLGAVIGNPSSALLGVDLRNNILHDDLNFKKNDWLVNEKSIYLSDSFDPADIDVMIDFSSPAASIRLVEICKNHSIPVVVGTTGFDDNQANLLKSAGAAIPILISPNMSLAVNVMISLIESAVAGLNAGNLGGGYDIEISEMHHRHKKDSPSGTALKMGETAAQASKINFSNAKMINSETKSYKRAPAQIGISSIRGGTSINEHRIIFAGDGEQLEIIHRSADLSIYASGAVRAAMFLLAAEAGIYSMKDVIDDKSA